MHFCAELHDAQWNFFVFTLKKTNSSCSGVGAGVAVSRGDGVAAGGAGSAAKASPLDRSRAARRAVRRMTPRLWHVS